MICLKSNIKQDINDMNKIIEELNQKIKSYEEEIESLKNEQNKNNKTISEYSNKIQELNDEISQLKESVNNDMFEEQYNMKKLLNNIKVRMKN